MVLNAISLIPDLKAKLEQCIGGYIMLIGRFQHRDNVVFGIIEGTRICLVHENIFDGIKATGEKLSFENSQLLAPVTPDLVIGLGRNYHGHIKEIGETPPERPAVFFKPGRSLIGQHQPVILPDWATRVDYEGELGVIIGKKMKNIPEDAVRDHIFGYTCFNDITERDIGMSNLLNQDISKCCDTFGPCGPWINTEFDPENALITTYLNGKAVQHDNTANTVYSVDQILSFLSTFMTLMPGDLVITGTPAGIGPLSPGDTVEIEIEGIGRLSNTVESGKPQDHSS